jgi:hypothetical protein
MNTRPIVFAVLLGAAPAFANASTTVVVPETTVDRVDGTAPESPTPEAPPVPLASSREAPPASEPATAPAPEVVKAAPEAAGPSDAPAVERFAVELSSRGVRPSDDGFGLFSDRRHLGLGGLGVRVPVSRDGVWTFSVGALIEGRKAMERDARGASVSLALNRPTLRGEAAYALHANLDLVGALGVGAERATFVYAATSPAEGATSEGWASTADVAVGVDGHVRLGPMLTALRLEGGYLASAPHALTVRLPDVGDVVRRPIDFGSVSTGGPFLRFALRVGY